MRDEFALMCREAPRLADYLKHHLPFYHRLREYSLGHA